MAVQKRRSVKSKLGAGARSKSRASGERPEGGDVGWGVGAESDDEDIFMRRVLFSVIVAVLGCMGAWFLVTTVNSGPQSRVLSATQNTRELYTVRLLEFPGTDAKLAVASELSRNADLRAIAGKHEFDIVELSDGRYALCVGRFESQDSPELQRLLKELRDYAEDGVHYFTKATIAVLAP